MKNLEADLLSAIKGDDAEMPDCIRPLSWLRSMVEACETAEAVTTLGREDPDAWFEMCREVRLLLERAEAAVSDHEPPINPGGQK